MTTPSIRVITAGAAVAIVFGGLAAIGATPVTATGSMHAKAAPTAHVKYRTIEIEGQSIFYR